MKMIPRVSISLAAVAWLVSAAALAQDSFDVKRNANFSAIRTFAFKDTPPLASLEEKTTTYDSPLMRERTTGAIAAQLEARGLTHDDENPDVYVVTRRSYYTQVYGPYSWGPYGMGAYPWAVSPYDRYYGPGWVGWDATMYTELRGTLTVDFVDAKTGELVWRGVETTHVHQTSKPESRDKRVSEEVADVFKHFPTVGAAAMTGVR